MYTFDGYMGEQRPADDATAAEAADATVRQDGRCVVPLKGTTPSRAQIFQR